MISLCFVGDYCISGRATDGDDPLQLVCASCQAAIDRADLAIANLESCLVEDGCQCDRFMAVSERDCGAVAKSGFDVLTLANNHILDCGPDSLLFTRNYLNDAGIQTVGAGMNIEQAGAPLVLMHDDRRIAIFSVTDATHYRARRNRAGVSPLYRKRLQRSVREISTNADLVIVCIHSDLEFSNYPAPWKVRLSRDLVQAGADIVVHHHPHTLQGIEMYDSALIAYSMGNFVFPVHGRKYMEGKDGYVGESAILQADVHFLDNGEKKITYDVVPTVIRTDNRTMAGGEHDAHRINTRIAEYSSALQDEAFLRRHYFGLCREQARRFVRGTYYALRKGGFTEAYAFLKTHFGTSMHRNWMRGFLSRGRY